jgi:uncharacterized protein (DUF2132 family)
MSEQYQNNPLHSLKLEVLLTELVDFYGWEILAAALNFNCFKTNPTMAGSLKFLRKTEWARHKLEAFYLYRYKHLLRPDDKQFALPPRDRIIPEDQKPRDPVVLTLEELERINARKAQNSKPQRSQRSAGRPQSRARSNSSSHSSNSEDPWANAKRMLADKDKGK